jgi:hypothetical protein
MFGGVSNQNTMRPQESQTKNSRNCTKKPRESSKKTMQKLCHLEFAQTCEEPREQTICMCGCVIPERWCLMLHIVTKWILTYPFLCAHFDSIVSFWKLHHESSWYIMYWDFPPSWVLQTPSAVLLFSGRSSMLRWLGSGTGQTPRKCNGNGHWAAFLSFISFCAFWLMSLPAGSGIRSVDYIDMRWYKHVQWTYMFFRTHIHI